MITATTAGNAGNHIAVSATGTTAGTVMPYLSTGTVTAAPATSLAVANGNAVTVAANTGAVANGNAVTVAANNNDFATTPPSFSRHPRTIYFVHALAWLRNNRLRGSLVVWRSLPEIPESVARCHATRGRAIPFEDDGGRGDNGRREDDGLRGKLRGQITSRRTKRTITRLALTLLIAATLTACQTTNPNLAGTGYGNPIGNAADTGSNNDNTNANNNANSANPTTTNKEIRQVHQWLFAGEYERASKWLNNALSRRLDNAELHFLNGLTYHLLSQTDISKRDLAAEGYNLSLKFDNTQWVPRYFLGLLAMEAKQYAEALAAFSEAALYNPDSERLLSDMAASAYLARRPDLAAGIYRQLLAKSPDNDQYRANYALTLAALNLSDDAAAELADMDDSRHAKFAQKRVKDWQRFHQTAAQNAALNAADTVTADDIIKAQAYPGYDDEDEFADEPEADTVTAAAGSGTDSGKQVILDVVFIRSDETTTSSRGINLLKTLQIQYSFIDTVVDDVVDTFPSVDDFGNAVDGNRTHTRTHTRNRGNLLRTELGLDGPESAVRYSLNIANNGSNRSEVLARPSLTVADGQTSTFFSGTAVLAAQSSTDGSSLQIERDIGVRLNVSPVFLDDERIRLNITAERTFLLPDTFVPSEDGGATEGGFDARIDTSKTEVQTTVIMKLGETLVLSGLSEKETGTARDGVPFLQDLPIIQYLFSNRTTLEFQRSVMILVTPRDPAYIYKPFDPAAEDGSVVQEFKAQHQDWFQPYPNWASVFNHLNNNQLYREFRTGDVTLEVWDSRATYESRLKEAVESFYY